MPHEIRRVLQAFASRPWFIERGRAEQMTSILELRAAHGPRGERFRADDGSQPAPTSTTQDRIAVMQMRGIVTPRGLGVSDICDMPPAAIALEQFATAFRQVANDPNVKAIVLDIDSPGGLIDFVPETAAMIRNAKSNDRPIIAVANTMAASAAYWIAAAADEIVITPSGEVGSIGVYVVHQDISQALADAGVQMTFISEGPRKVEGNPYEPLSPEASAAMQANVRYYYDMFTAEVAKARGVDASVVRADPEVSDQHFGGGRTYPAKIAVKLGMADRVDTLDGVITKLKKDLSAKSGARKRNAAIERRRLALI